MAHVLALLMSGRRKGYTAGVGEGWLTELSTDELRDLMMLRREAVGG